MASVILNGVGSSFGSSILGGAIGKTVGGMLGSLVGQTIDQALFGSPSSTSSGRRLEEVSMQTASYGRPIPVVYGTAKLAGNIIWATQLKEEATTSSTATGGKFSRVKHHHTQYTYSISIAIAICEGPILSIERMWADDIEINMSAYKIRIYRGDEEQSPDPLIEKVQGMNKASAHRGLAYVVIEDLLLSDFGNKLPLFSFEVRKREATDPMIEVLEDRINELIMIPGSGEFVYDTVVQTKITGFENEGEWISYKPRNRINSHTNLQIANSIVSLNQMQENLPKVQWVATVAGWFSNSCDIKDAQILPGVEFKTGGTTSPDQWHVGEYNRESAYEISQNNGSVNYGGTPSDGSILRYFQELKRRKLKTMFIPMFFIDTKEKLWRGRINCRAEEISHFFRKKNGYNRFVLHYAKLLKGLVDAFIIGSELVSLTKTRDEHNTFPAATELASLATLSRGILGNEVKISYAADWSEYHHADGGWHSLDDLWACQDIDFIGIDAYFPLTDEDHSSKLTVNSIKNGWDSGELYNFYYDGDGNRKALAPEWAIKNIEYWWNNVHYNPNGERTPWIPRSKNIWFTELGFPSVTMATNQPNVFYDPTSLESKFPNKSTAATDFVAQRKGLIASLNRWQGSNTVEKQFIWAWDARPYPHWPALKNSWADGDKWEKGHWIQGKVGIGNLAKVVLDLCLKSGIQAENIDTHSLSEHLDIGIQGLIIAHNQPIKSVMEDLELYYNFFILEDGDKICFKTRERSVTCSLNKHSLIPFQTEHGIELLNLKRTANSGLPSVISVSYIDKFSSYRIKTKCFSKSINGEHGKTINLNLPIISSDAEASNVANRILYSAWSSRNCYYFSLPMHYLYLRSGDLIEIKLEDVQHLIRITDIDISGNNLLKIKGVSEEFSETNKGSVSSTAHFVAPKNNGKAAFAVLDIPLLAQEEAWDEPRALIACYPEEEHWNGCTIYYFDEHDGRYIEVATVSRAATVGIAATAVAPANHHLIDDKNQITVYMQHGYLESLKFEQFFSGGNLALLGNEIIQFKNANLISSGQYILSTLQRGLYGTERHIQDHKSNEAFILLNKELCTAKLPMHKLNSVIQWHVVSNGFGIAAGDSKRLNYVGHNLIPLAPFGITKSSDYISWNRRARGEGLWLDFQDAPLRESQELYEVSFNYKNSTNCMQITTREPRMNLTQLKIDINLFQSLTIKQVSAKVGYGFEAVMTLAS